MKNECELAIFSIRNSYECFERTDFGIEPYFKIKNQNTCNENVLNLYISVTGEKEEGRVENPMQTE